MEEKKSAMDKVKDKFETKKSELIEDILKSKVERRIGSVTEVDGKLKAEFSLEGLPAEEKGGKGEPFSYHDRYRSWTKIFDSWKELSKYAEPFFSATVDELKEMVKNK